jgi:hypothetical protein
MQNDELNLEELVRVYIKIRSAIEDMEERHKEELQGLKEQQQHVSDALLKFCNDQNLDSVKTSAGTISRRVNSKYWTTDWESLYRAVAKHGAYHLLERRLNNNNVKQFIEEFPEDFPPGLQATRSYVVSVRKPTEK